VTSVVSDKYLPHVKSVKLQDCYDAQIDLTAFSTLERLSLNFEPLRRFPLHNFRLELNWAKESDRFLGGSMNKQLMARARGDYMANAFGSSWITNTILDRNRAFKIINSFRCWTLDGDALDPQRITCELCLLQT
jgi:hypothetical protein